MERLFLMSMLCLDVHTNAVKIFFHFLCALARTFVELLLRGEWSIWVDYLDAFFFANWVRLRRLLRNAASSRQQEHNNINNNISENFNIPTWCSFAALKKSLFLDRGHTYIVCVDMVISRESLDRNDTKTAPRRRRRYVCIMQRREETGERKRTRRAFIVLSKKSRDILAEKSVGAVS